MHIVQQDKKAWGYVPFYKMTYSQNEMREGVACRYASLLTNTKCSVANMFRANGTPTKCLKHPNVHLPPSPFSSIRVHYGRQDGGDWRGGGGGGCWLVGGDGWLYWYFGLRVFYSARVRRPPSSLSREKTLFDPSVGVARSAGEHCNARARTHSSRERRADPFHIVVNLTQIIHIYIYWLL